MDSRIFTLAGVLGLAACNAAPSTDEPAGSDAVILQGATLIDGTGGAAIENAVIHVEGTHITCAGSEAECPVPAGADPVDLAGHFITPGLVDAHVHFGQTGWIDGRPDGVEAPDVYPYAETVAYARNNPGRWHAAYLCSGITAVYDVGGQDWTVTEAHATDTDRPDRVHVRAAGPLTTHASARNSFFEVGGAADQPLFLPMETAEGVRANVDHLVSIGSQAVKVWYLAPREDDRERLDALLMETGAAAREAGLPLIVHATSLREAKMALRAGAGMLVHSVQNEPVDQEFLDLLLANDAVYAPTLVVGGNWTHAVASVALQEAAAIDDPNGCVDAEIRDRIQHPERMFEALAPTGQQIAMMGQRDGMIEAGLRAMQANLLAVAEAGGRVVTATDAGNPMTLHGPSIYNEMEAMEAAGLTPDKVIEMSTRAGAEAMGMGDDFGTVEAGKRADLIVLSADPRESVRNFRMLTHVMRNGALRTQAELRVFEAE